MKKLAPILLTGTLVLVLAAFWLVNSRDKNPTVPASPTASETAQGSYRNITPRELNDMLTRKDFYLINVHVPYEGEIKGTDAFIPYNEVTGNGKLPADKTAKIILYCRTGRMSTEAAISLAAAGYTNLYNLNGGMVAWEKQGYEITAK